MNGKRKEHCCLTCDQAKMVMMNPVTTKDSRGFEHQVYTSFVLVCLQNIVKETINTENDMNECDYRDAQERRYKEMGIDTDSEYSD